MTEVAFPKRAAARSMDEKVLSLMEVKLFQVWVSETRLTEWLLLVRRVASVAWYLFYRHSLPLYVQNLRLLNQVIPMDNHSALPYHCHPHKWQDTSDTISLCGSGKRSRCLWVCLSTNIWKISQHHWSFETDRVTSQQLKANMISFMSSVHFLSGSGRFPKISFGKYLM